MINELELEIYLTFKNVRSLNSSTRKNIKLTSWHEMKRVLSPCSPPSTSVTLVFHISFRDVCRYRIPCILAAFLCVYMPISALNLILFWPHNVIWKKWIMDLHAKIFQTQHTDMESYDMIRQGPLWQFNGCQLSNTPVHKMSSCIFKWKWSVPGTDL